ncbi:MAG: hypothetical protein VB092_09790 [Oscillospiraceae bacterium]|nr:hypothetical protein [Oscillospiraceae bacterium]
MYGYRERIGLILPSTNTVAEQEFFRMAPEGISTHVTRVKLTATNPDSLRVMANNAERAVDEMMSCLSDVIIYGCTSGSFLQGAEWEKKFRSNLCEIAQRPVLTTAYDCLLALNAFGKKNIAIATPYIDSLNKAAYNYFSGVGYNIVSMKGLGIEAATDIGKNPPHAIYNLAKSAVTKDTELLFISCTGVRSVEIVDMLEQDLGIPVFSSNIANLWSAMRTHGLNEKLKGFGSLFNL